MSFQIRHVIVPTDFSGCAEVALAQALAIARLQEVKLHLVHVLPSYESDPFVPLQAADWRGIYEEQDRRCAERMAELVDTLDMEGVDLQQHRPRAPAVAPAILRLVDELKADLIVMGGHGRRGFRRFLLGSVTEEVVRLASCPVLTLREVSLPVQERWPQRIVVPIDLSQHSRFALESARRLAGPESQLELVHVVDRPVSPPYDDPWFERDPEIDFPTLAVKAEEAVERFASAAGGPQRESRIEVLEGRAASTIAHYAEVTGSDLIVIATHGLTGLPHLLMGSVTEKLVRVAACPVLTLKTHSTARQAGEKSA